MKNSIIAAVAVFGIIAFVFILESLGVEWLRYFKPKYENVERETFLNTKSYNEGMVQELAKHFHEYQTGDEETKAAISGVIRVNFSNFPAERIENEGLRKFLVEQRGF